MNMPKYWDVAKTGEMYDFTKKPKEIVYSNYDYLPFIVMDLIPVGSTYSGNFKLKKSTEISSGTYIEDGDILLAKITPCFENGKQCIITGLPNGFGIASTEIIPIKEKTGTSSKYFLFYYLLQSDIRTLIAGKMEGATGRQRVPVHLIKELLIPFPSLNEQQKIAAVLFKIQQAIEIQVAIIEKTRELKKSTLHHVFTNGLRGEKLKETEIGPMPESWDLIKIGKYCDIRSSTISFNELNQGRSDDSDVLCYAIKVSDMNLPGNEKYIFTANIETKLSSKLVSEKAIPANSVIFPKRGAAIATNKKRLTTIWSLLDPNLIAIMPRARITSEFLYYWFLTFDLASIQDLGPTPQLNKKDVEPISIPCPSDGEQSDISNIFRSIDQKIDLHTVKKSTLQDLFKTMLNKLMTGEIRVKDLDIDVSEVSK